MRFLPDSVCIDACYLGPSVAMDHTVRIHHWDYLEYIVVVV